MRPRHYTFNVEWSKEDQEFVGLCAEFPSLSFLDKGAVGARRGIEKIVNTIVADMDKNYEVLKIQYKRSRQ